MAKHISRNHFVDISITLGQKRLFHQMGYNLFAKVTVLPKGYYFCAKGAVRADERRGKRKTGQWLERNPVTALFYVLQNIVFADSTILTRKNVNTQGNIEGGVHRGDLFVDDDGSIYVMSITTEWQNAPKGDEGNWIKIRIN